MTDSMSERMDAIERFAADVAHEIKNPLTSIRSAIETLDLVTDPAARARLLGILQQDVTRWTGWSPIFPTLPGWTRSCRARRPRSSS
jgi:hypothetical protein